MKMLLNKKNPFSDQKNSTIQSRDPLFLLAALAKIAKIFRIRIPICFLKYGIRNGFRGEAEAETNRPSYLNTPTQSN